MGTEAEVLDGLTGVLGAAQQQGVGTSGLLKSQLVQGDGLATSGKDASAGGGGEAQSGDGHLGDLEQTDVVGDGADDNDSLLVVAVLQVGLDAGQGDRGPVDAGHKQTAQDNLVEGRVGTTCSSIWVRIGPGVFLSGSRAGCTTYEPGSGTASRGA